MYTIKNTRKQGKADGGQGFAWQTHCAELARASRKSFCQEIQWRAQHFHQKINQGKHGPKWRDKDDESHWACTCMFGPRRCPNCWSWEAWAELGDARSNFKAKLSPKPIKTFSWLVHKELRLKIEFWRAKSCNNFLLSGFKCFLVVLKALCWFFKFFLSPYSGLDLSLGKMNES